MFRRRRRVAVTTAALVCAGSVFGPVVLAQADTTGSFYVNNSSGVTCSDSTTDSAVTPYCTIQAAVDAASAPGDTVIVSPGRYTPFIVTDSGTAAAPITIESSTGTGIGSGPWALVQGISSSAVTLTGASDVVIRGLHILQSSNHSGVTVAGSAGDTLQDTLVDQVNGGAAPIVSIGAGSSSVTVSQNELEGTSNIGPALATQGGSDDVITTNAISNLSGSGIALNDTTSSDVTSNTVNEYCGSGIAVANGSISASVENNVVSGMSKSPSACGTTATAEALLQVDNASVPGTSADYNVSQNDGSGFPNVYSWAGSYYGTAATFYAATGQGAHDVSGAPIIDSANSDAPGELSTDLYGNARVDDPDVADTGTGTYSYYDRGAVELVDPASVWPTSQPAQAPVGGVGDYVNQVSDSWGNAFTCSYSFGDGTAPVPVTPDGSGDCGTLHAYTAVGSYQGSLAVTFSDGYVSTKKFTVVVVADSALTPVVATTASGALGVEVDASKSTDSWDIVKCSFDFGDASAPLVESGSTCGADHSYARSGTYTVTTTLSDAGGIQQSVTDSFTTVGSSYTPVVPTRILDTRNGTGVTAAGPVAANGIVKLKIAGVDGLPPTGVTAVALNVTATEATRLGVITAYPDGQSVPDVSNVDFHADQNVANTVIVAVGGDGYVDLANVSSGTTDFIADLQGYYAVGGSSGYHSITPIRELDTRKTTAIPAGHTVKVDLSTYPEISAAVVNLTVVGATGNGFISASPDGGAASTTSNVNYLAGQTVPNEAVVAVGADGFVDFTNSGKGQAQLVVDLDGYFTTGSGDAFVPVSPERYFDTRPGPGLGENQTFVVGIGGLCPSDPSCTSAPAVPKGAAAVAANLTVVSPKANGFITVFPADVSTAPTASVLNFLTGQQTQNAISVGLAPLSGEFAIRNASSGQIETVVDVFGYYGD